jgi:hypothetical protein
MPFVRLLFAFYLPKPEQQDIDGYCVSDWDWLQVTIAFFGSGV